jgi:hypothetical protein
MWRPNSPRKAATWSATRPCSPPSRSIPPSTVRTSRRPMRAGPPACRPTSAFAVKLPKAITHEARLREVDALLDRFAGEAIHLGAKLGCVLVQLPPKGVFDEEVARDFLPRLRQRLGCMLALEARHPTWFSEAATDGPARTRRHPRDRRSAGRPARAARADHRRPAISACTARRRCITRAIRRRSCARSRNASPCSRAAAPTAGASSITRRPSRRCRTRSR